MVTRYGAASMRRRTLTRGDVPPGPRGSRAHICACVCACRDALSSFTIRYTMQRRHAGKNCLFLCVFFACPIYFFCFLVHVYIPFYFVLSMEIIYTNA